MSEREFVEQFTARDDAGELILKRGEGGCVFLEGNLCSVYEARPQNCVNFPHVVRGSGSIASRMWEFLDRAGYCPIVYNWMERSRRTSGLSEDVGESVVGDRCALSAGVRAAGAGCWSEYGLRGAVGDTGV